MLLGIINNNGLSIFTLTYIDKDAGPKFKKSQKLSANIASSNRNQKKVT